MSQNIGTLVGSAIRPIDGTMPIASAFAFEINGGHHQVSTLVDRNNIMVQRRQWGMLCTVYADSTSANNVTYQLKYGYSSTDSMDNANWVLFAGSVGSAGSSSWVDPVLSISTTPPVYPVDGERYLVGKNSVASLSGAFSTLTNIDYSGNLVGGFIAEYKTALTTWTTTLPTNGMTIRVNNDDNSFYRYEGTYSTGQWYKERVNQVRTLSATSANKIDYSITSGDFFTYSTEVVYLVQFATANAGGTSSININSLGSKNMKKQTSTGITNLDANDLNTTGIYHLIYDGTYFRVNTIGGGSSTGGSSVKYKIVSDERIVVPAYSEYLLHGDLEVNGVLDISSTGKVVIINGALNINGGTVSNSGNVSLVTLPTSTLPGEINYLPKWNSSTTISATSSITDDGSLVTIDSIIRLKPTTEPVGATAGVIYFDSGTNKLRAYDGSTWNDLW